MHKRASHRNVLVCFVTRLARNSQLPFLPERVGRWWRHDEEIDVVAISDTDKALLVGECKWSSKPIGLNILVDLQRKAKALQGEGGWQITYALFAQSGFTPALMALAQTAGILLAGPAELVGE